MGEMTVYKQQPVATITYADMERMADCIAKSGLFGVKTQVQALALMLLAQSEGLHPVTAARDYHVIQGRPTLKADTMLARFQAAGGKIEWHDYTDTIVSGTFSHPAGGKVKIEWTLDQAKSAGLTGKDVWKQYPRAMLRARVISEGIRTVYPLVLSGMYTPEEVRDIVEVQGTAETSGPDHSAPTPVSVRDFDDEIQSMTNPDDIRPWLIDTAKSYGWTKTDPVYLALKAACAEHAEHLRNQANPVTTQSADDFEADLGPVEDLS